MKLRGRFAGSVVAGELFRFTFEDAFPEVVQTMEFKRRLFPHKQSGWRGVFREGTSKQSADTCCRFGEIVLNHSTENPCPVCRGGNYFDLPGNARCSVRLGLRGPAYSDSRDGFRIALGTPRKPKS